MGNDEKYVTIQQFNGGYLVSIGGQNQITTSLNKAIKLVRDFLNTEGESEAE